MNYENLKKIWEEEYKEKALLLGCFILVFLVGFGTGRYNASNSRHNPSQANYNTKSLSQPTSLQKTETLTNQTSVKTILSATSTKDCIVKGNISSTGKKIYHILGGAFYKTVKPEQCFKNEAEALAEGFVKSSR